MRGRRLASAAAGWTVVGLVLASQSYLFLAQIGQTTGWRPLVRGLSAAYAWALLTPVVVRVARHAPLERGRAGRAVAAHVCAALALSVVWMALVLIPDRLMFTYQTGSGAVGVRLMMLPTALLLYAATAAVAMALAQKDSAAEQQARAAALSLQLAEAELQALRARLHPHFLFNTLQSISALMHEDVRAADALLADLADLLRLSLTQLDRDEVTVADELDFVHRYLAIEQARLGDRLTVREEVEPDVRTAIVPAMLLQPIVENAVRHGVALSEDGGTVWLSAHRSGRQLQIDIADDGPGPPSGPVTERIGLGTTRQRLERTFGAMGELAMATRPGGGVVVRVSLPYRTG